MRIMHISSAKNFGGGERHVVDLCRGLQERGHEVFAATRPTCDWQNRLDFLPVENILSVSIRNSFGVLSAIRMAEFARDNKIDILHAHVARDYIPTSIACMKAREARFVLTRHVLFPLKPFNRFALKNVAAAIGVSDAAGIALRSVFSRDKIAVIPNGIDIKRMAAENSTEAGARFREFHGIPDDVPLVTTLGELKELKGQRDFVIAASEIAKKVPDCQFIVVGVDNTMEKSFRRELRRLVSVFGLEDRFLWLDWLDDTAPFYAATDVFVSPSHSESFGLAILEAMARGKAVVATETEGAKQLLKECGRLVPINDPVALADTVIEVLADNAAREKMGLDGSATAADLYSLETMLDATEALYQKILSDHNKS
ncbi:MAG: glycosyltransferase family 4 protein [Acidobacteria bacterium]|nr:glycosyltransferase family 4 protein [Acidobacteriota bacterium]